MPNLSLNQEVTLTPNFTDINGNTILGLIPTWECDNTSVISIKVAGDGMSCRCWSVLTPGYANVYANVLTFSVEVPFTVAIPVNCTFLITSPVANGALTARLGQ